MSNDKKSIDEIAAGVEQMIEKNEEILNKYEGKFDPKYRRMEEAQVAELF